MSSPAYEDMGDDLRFFLTDTDSPLPRMDSPLSDSEMEVSCAVKLKRPHPSTNEKVCAEGSLLMKTVPGKFKKSQKKPIVGSSSVIPLTSKLSNKERARENMDFLPLFPTDTFSGEKGAQQPSTSRPTMQVFNSKRSCSPEIWRFHTSFFCCLLPRPDMLVRRRKGFHWSFYLKSFCL